MTMIKRKNRQCRPLNQCVEWEGAVACCTRRAGGGWRWGWLGNEWTVAQSNRNVIEAHEGSLKRYRFWGRAAGQVGVGAAVAVAVGAVVEAEGGKGDGRPMVSSFKCWLSVCRLVAFFACGFRFWGQSEATNCGVQAKGMGRGGEGRSHTRNCIEKASSSEESVASLAALCAAAAANWELGIEMDAIQALIWWHHRPMGASASGGHWQQEGGRVLGQGGMCSWTLSVAAASAHCSLINDAPYGLDGPERLGKQPSKW